MPEVFKRSALNFGGAFTTNRGLLSFLTPGGQAVGLTPLLVQNLSLEFSQQITRLYEVADGATVPSVYEVGGRAQGAMAIAQVVGPRVLVESMYSTFGQICNAPRNIVALTFATGCPGDDTRLIYLAKYCLLSRLGMGVTVTDMLVQSNSQLAFSSLEHVVPTPPKFLPPAGEDEEDEE